MKEFNFNSQVCTDRNQSERLLALGLKKETADMCYKVTTHDWRGHEIPEKDRHYSLCSWYDELNIVCGFEQVKTIPAWSLHRMWELICNRKKYESKEGDEYPKIYLNDDCVIVENPKSIWARHNFCSLRGVYENVINCIEWLIKEGYFNKEYLV